MLKTLEDLCPEQSPEDVVLDYARDYFSDSDWPPSVVLAVLELNDPDRTYAIDTDVFDNLATSGDAVDVTEGIEVAEERQREISALEKRLAELKCQLAG